MLVEIRPKGSKVSSAKPIMLTTGDSNFDGFGLEEFLNNGVNGRLIASACALLIECVDKQNRICRDHWDVEEGACCKQEAVARLRRLPHEVRLASARIADKHDVRPISEIR